MSRRINLSLGMACLFALLAACEKVDRSDSLGPSASTVPEPTIITTESGVEMVLIPAGQFKMGSDQGEGDQQPVHEVAIDAFLMDRYEVTQAVYTRMDPINGSHFKGPELPTEMIGWDKAALYCNLRSEAEGLEPCYNERGQCNFAATGYRLPTEAEWEYACRADSESAWSFGPDAAQLDRYAWFQANANKKTHEVGRKQPNAFGLYDMHGNVAEWCNDFYAADYYQHSPRDNPQGPATGDKYVLRGGHWGASPTACQSAHRASEEPGFSDACFARDAIGFRCVRRVSAQRSTTPAAIGCHVPWIPVMSAFALVAVACACQDSPADTAAVRPSQRVGFVYSDVCLRHDTGAGHPERTERLTAIRARLTENQVMPTLTQIETRAAAERWLTTVHTPAHVRSIRASCEGQGGFAGTRDTPVSGHSYQAALHAAGGGLAAVDAVMSGKVQSAFCAVRPPGHHATATKAMGFCLFNNVAIAARYVQQKFQLKKVLIVDWDVHHGNGTQAIFLEDPTVFYFSVHRYPFYPGTGSAEERGAGKGFGSTLNVPLPAGSGDAEFCRAIEHDLRQAADAFQPDFVLVSAGFDAHRNDPLGGMNVTCDGYARMTGAVKRIANKHCQGRLVSLLEGGYDLEALAASVETHLRALQEPLVQ